jgi:UDP-N-acetylglucosamine transferase subunit ALG13
VSASRRVDVLVACSSGGHLFDAVAIAPAWRDRSRAWVSFDKADVQSLLAGEALYVAHGPTNRNVPNLLRNLRLAWRVVGETRPRVLLTTGAGVAVPFAWIARVRGAHVIYVECAGRVDRPSLSARLIAPIARDVYAQWPELAAKWRRARYAGNVLHATSSPESVPERRGVLVTVGTNEAPFDRLIEALPGIVSGGEPVLVQHGASNVRPAGARCVDFLPYDELDGLTRSARAVICHAGIGSVALALARGHRPVVVPRMRQYGEAVDDHQVFFARRLAESGLATVVEDVQDLPAALECASEGERFAAGPDLCSEISRVLDAILDG